MTDAMRLQMAASPHLRAGRTTRRIMLDVLIALAPAVLWSILLFGWRVLPHYALTICTAVAADVAVRGMREAGFLFKSPHGGQLQGPKPAWYAAFDFSPVVTGTLLAMSLPVSAPLWYGPLGAAIGIVLAKELFGGIGRNFVNPALAGRAVLRIAFAAQMTQNPVPTPLIALPIFQYAALGVDAVTTATPLWVLKAGSHLSTDGLLASFLGLTAGKIGETSALLLLLGAAYLVARGVIRLRIPLAMLGAIAVMAWLFGSPAGFARADISIVLGHLLGGATVLGAFYMATDYSSSPTVPGAQVAYGAALGIVTMLFRFLGGYSEGFTFAALLVNLTVPLLNRLVRPRVLGEGTKEHNAN